MDAGKDAVIEQGTGIVRTALELAAFTGIAQGVGLLGLSAFAAWRGGARSALRLWGAYLGGNTLWNKFGHDMGNTGARNAVNMGLLTAYALRAGKQSPAARWLALPFVAWLGYVALGTRATRKRNPLLSRFF